MTLMFLTGGARSGKSWLAQRAALATGRPVSVVVTATAGDEEMERRISRHRADRPANWTTIEAPIELAASVLSIPTDHVVVIDCVSMWIANLMLDGRSDEFIEAATSDLCAVLHPRESAIAVTNEVGSAVVPDNELARRYRDVLGRANGAVSGVSSDAFLVVAGRLLRLEPAPW